MGSSLGRRPSSQVTDPTKQALMVHVAGVAGNTVTLAWYPPANNDYYC